MLSQPGWCKTSTSVTATLDHSDFALWLANKGIASISLKPDSVIDTWQRLAAK